LELTDREEIRELTARYAKAIDEKDYRGIAECFAEGAAAHYNGFSLVLTGREEIVAHMRQALEPLDATQHMFSNFIIEGDAAQARLTCDILAQHVKGGAADRDTYLAGGRYTVELRKTAGRWQIAKLQARSVWGMGSRELLPKSG
jgi:uncharacterized protein (TIGR02246 family)